MFTLYIIIGYILLLTIYYYWLYIIIVSYVVTLFVALTHFARDNHGVKSRVKCVVVLTLFFQNRRLFCRTPSCFSSLFTFSLSTLWCCESDIQLLKWTLVCPMTQLVCTLLLLSYWVEEIWWWSNVINFDVYLFCSHSNHHSIW